VDRFWSKPVLPAGIGVKKMFACRKQTIVSALFLVFVAGAWAQTQNANLKTPENAPSAAADTKPLDVAPGYIVGESDVLRVNVWKEPEVSQTVVVRTDGSISLPLINEVKVAGMTPMQIQVLVAEKLKSFLNSPQVTVTVTEIHSKKAFITGEVARPGGYSLNTEITVLQLIAQAGGFTVFAKRDGIVVLRIEDGKALRLHFKYKEVVHGKNTEQNVALHPGDTVVVP
jgi:polysaccharide export outer membrane protein